MQLKLFCKFLLFTAILIFINNAVFPQTTTKTDNSCGCDYLPLCNFSAKKTVQGVVYYGLGGSENKRTYYNCTNGVITKLWYTEDEVFSERLWQWRNDINDYGWVDYYKTVDVPHYLIIVKYNVPVGTKWITPKSSWQFSLAEKKATHVYGDKILKDVIKIRTIQGYTATYLEHLKAKEQNVNAVYYDGQHVTKAEDNYYAKNLGFIYSENAMENIETEEEKNLTTIVREKRKKDEAFFYDNATTERKEQITKNANNKVQFTGVVDKTLAGLWNYYERCKPYISFELDQEGNFRYLVYEIEKKRGKWKVYKDTMMISWNNDGNIILEKYPLGKVNNAYTGNPSLTLKWADGSIKEFEISGDKAPWPDLPAYGQQNTSQNKLFGIIDTEILGSWKFEDNKNYKTIIYTFNDDGTGLYQYNYNNQKKITWRLDGTTLNIIEQRKDGMPCAEGIGLEKTKKDNRLIGLKIDYRAFVKIK